LESNVRDNWSKVIEEELDAMGKKGSEILKLVLINQLNDSKEKLHQYCIQYINIITKEIADVNLGEEQRRSRLEKITIGAYIYIFSN